MGSKELARVKRQEDGFLKPFESLDRVFEDLSTFPLTDIGKTGMSAVDMKETEKEILLSVDLPGVDKKDIKLDINDNSITISCERNEEKEEKNKGGYRIRETRYGRFYRSFPLPAEVKARESKASYKNGVLKVTLQKQNPGTSHQITIE
jgi:HSP20 family protein